MVLCTYLALPCYILCSSHVAYLVADISLSRNCIEIKFPFFFVESCRSRTANCWLYVEPGSPIESRCRAVYTSHIYVLPPFPIVKDIETYIQVIVLVCCLCAADRTGPGCANTLRRVRGFCLTRGCRRDFLFATTFLGVVSSILSSSCCLEAGIPPALTSPFHTTCRQALCYFRQNRQGGQAGTYARRCGPGANDSDGSMARGHVRLWMGGEQPAHDSQQRGGAGPRVGHLYQFRFRYAYSDHGGLFLRFPFYTEITHTPQFRIKSIVSFVRSNCMIGNITMRGWRLRHRNAPRCLTSTI
jgi:hypothetical protein